MKRVAIISDLHCGHKAGLTPPSWQSAADEDKAHPDHKLAVYAAKLWDWYDAEVKATGAVDLLVVNGDAIDGKGERSGGSEQLTTDREEQVMMAEKAIRLWKARQTLLVYGTAYHTGKEEDWERVLANNLGSHIGSHEWANVDGVVFDFKHHIGSSSIPHGRYTAAARDRLWNSIWADEDLQPQSDIVIRSHVHYHAVSMDWSPARKQYRMAMTTPPLQGMGTKYGARRCSGIVHYGFLTFTVDKGIASCPQVHAPSLGFAKPVPVKV